MKSTTLSTCLTFALVAGFAGLAAARPAAAQDPEPTRTQDARPEAKPSPDEVKARWKTMTPQERKRMQESFARWQKLSDEDKEKLRQRHARLDDARRTTRDLLSDEERARLEKLKDGERRAELTARSKKQLRERFDRDGSGEIDRLEESEAISCSIWREVERDFDRGGLGLTMAHYFGFDGSEWHPGALAVARAHRSAVYAKMRECGLEP